MVKSRATHELPKLEENHTTFWICPDSCKLVQMENMKTNPPYRGETALYYPQRKLFGTLFPIP
ncbi:hypothetical protein C0J52_00572 [Blattella germanica]|nr:hypothetical protein C0J52_00572 [Blattella germanica]